MRRLLTMLVFIATTLQIAYTQETNFVYKPFGSTRLINMPTTEMISNKGYEVVIQHKFGKTDIEDNMLSDLLGMDLSTNIRFGFDIALAENWSIGIGRAKTNKQFDLSTKHRFLRQTNDNKCPISAAIQATIYHRSSEFPELGDDYYYADGSPFSYQPRHRYSFETTLIISRKFKWLSLVTTPTLLRRNLVTPTEENFTYVVPVGGRVPIGIFSSLMAEYSATIRNSDIYPNNWALGYEIKSATHVFQIHLSSNQQINNTLYYTSSKNADLNKGTFYMGFTITKLFWIKK